jgi:hypothetical protein
MVRISAAARHDFNGDFDGLASGSRPPIQDRSAAVLIFGGRATVRGSPSET